MNNKFKSIQSKLEVLIIGTILIIAGCGGGDGGTSGGQNFYLSGIAASGAAINEADVSVKDKNGNIKNTTTDLDGKYQIEVTDLIPPFLLKVSRGGLTLYSVATEPGIANIHPFTDLIIRNWYKVKGKNVVTVFESTGPLANPPTSQGIATIENGVKLILRPYLLGVGITNIDQFNLISTSFDADKTFFDLLIENLKVDYSDGNIKITFTWGDKDNPIVNIPENTELSKISPFPQSKPDSEAPSIPLNLTATRINNTQVVLSWNPSTDTINVAGYKIYRNNIQVGIIDLFFYVDGDAPSANACYTIAAYDSAGNSSEQSTQVCAKTGQEDTVPPSPPILTATFVSPTQIDLSWSASTDNVAVAGYRIFVNGILTISTSNTSFSHIGFTQNNTYSYTIVALDTSGNYALSNSVTIPFSLPNLISPPDNSFSMDNSLSFDWSDGEGSVEYDFQVDNNSDFSSPVINISLTKSEYTIDTGLADGPYWWKVRVKEAAYNISGWTSSWKFTIDTKKPTTTATPSGGLYNSNISVILNADESADIYYTLDGTAPTENSAKYTAALQINSTTTLKFFAVDAAGNEEQQTREEIYTLDKTAPSVSITNPADASMVSGVVDLTANAIDTISGISKVEFYYNDKNLIGSDTNSPYSVHWDTTSLPDGEYTLMAKAFDAGNLSAVSQGVNVTVDNTPPQTTATPSGGLYNSNISVILSADEPADIYYTLDGTAPTANSAKYTAALQINSTTTMKFFAVDAAGNKEQQTREEIYTLDKTAPSVSITNPADASTVSGVIDLTANAIDTISGISKVEFYYNDKNLIGSDTNSPYSIQWYTTSLPDGEYTLTAKAFDTAKNSIISSGIAVNVYNPPILNVYPASLDFGAEDTQKTLTISNTGIGPLTWTVATDQNWLIVDPNSEETLAGEISFIIVTLDRNSMSPGEYSGKININSNGGYNPNVSVPVTMTKATQVCGSITEDTTWYKTNSPYLVACSIVIPQDNTLTIEPGVIVKFKTDMSIQVNGILIAQGTEDDNIIFTSYEEDWGFIYFSDSSVDASYDVDGNYVKGSILEHCVIEYAGGVNVTNNAAVRLEKANPFINYTTIKNNKAKGINGWGLSELKITNSIISFNQDGGIRANGGIIYIFNNTISHNKNSQTGGGGITGSGNITISNNTISYNTSQTSGGGICCAETATISNNIINYNTSQGSGGGIWSVNSYRSTIIITNNAINFNTTTLKGGGIWAGGGGTISKNIISYNTSQGSGGGIYTGQASGINLFTISNNIICYNNTQGDGGGIYNKCDRIETISDNSIIKNRACNASALWRSGDSNITYNLFIGNHVTSEEELLHYTIYISNSPTFNYNNLVHNTGSSDVIYELYNSVSQGSADINTKDNWWGTNIKSEIEGKVYDFSDDSTLGIIDFVPWASSIRIDAPISPPTGLTVTEISSTNISLNWTENPEGDTAGYKIYYDTQFDHPYKNVVDVGKTTAYKLNIPAGVTYYLTITAYDADANGNDDLCEGHESWYGEGVSVTIKP